MTRSLRAAGAIAAACLFAATVAAQGGPAHFGVGTGLAIPVGDYHAAARGEGFNTAWQPMVFVAFKPRIIPAAVRLDITYGANNGNDQLNADLTTAIGQPAREQAKLVGINVDLVYPAAATARLQPYLVGGIGAYHTTVSVTVGDSTPSDAATKLAWNLGGGINYELRPIALFLEARYLSVAAVGPFPRTTLLPITTGVRFGGR
jgi:opacity protein-like surface antigen